MLVYEIVQGQSVASGDPQAWFGDAVNLEPRPEFGAVPIHTARNHRFAGRPVFGRCHRNPRHAQGSLQGVIVDEGARHRLTAPGHLARAQAAERSADVEHRVTFPQILHERRVAR